MNNPPEEQLLESGTLQIEQFDDVDAADTSEDKQVACASHPPTRGKKITRAPRSKKARITDVIEKSNEQIWKHSKFDSK